MKNFSDNTIPSTTIVGLLPEVHKSDLNASVMGTSFDRLLTKDDSVRVSGYIGRGNTNARVSRQVIEETPHRQANQLAPTMVTQVGAATSALSFNAFLSQLDLMGVDRNRLESWGTTTKFNWIPPVNIDMLVNFADYFWVPRKRGDIPQYLTIENTCNKATSALTAFIAATKVLGSEFKVERIEFESNSMVLKTDATLLFTPEFVVETQSNSPRFKNTQWTVDTATFDALVGETSITLMEPIASVSSIKPANPTSGQLWFNNATQELKVWTGNEWVATSVPDDLVFDLQPALSRLRYNTACACSGSVGFDTTKFDTHGWDAATSCAFPQENEWTTNNQWIHKSEVKSTANAKRATVPILEYTNSIEMNSWIHVSRQWKYRSSPTLSFAETQNTPVRLELEPIKGYRATNVDGKWFIYAYVENEGMVRDVDYTSTFVPGYKFAIRDDSLNYQVYTVANAEYREITSTDPSEVAEPNAGVMCTIIELVEPTFSSVVQGSHTNQFRIEPVFTSEGDTWCGYHAHWVVNMESTVTTPASQQQITAAAAEDATGKLIEATDDDRAEANASTVMIGHTFQQFANMPAGTTVVPVLKRFTPSDNSYVYAIAGTNSLRVYVNGNLQQLNYTEQTDSYSPRDTAVGVSLLSGQSFEYVSAVVLETPLLDDDIVRVEFGPAAFVDTGMNVVPVRTIEDENEFIIAIADSLQPVYVSLSAYEKRQQLKTTANQYPQFNVYDVVTGEVVDASPLFTYKESGEYPVSAAVQRRIVRDDEGKDFAFEQHLVDRSNNIIYGYRDVTQSSDFWYNPTQNKVYQWSNGAWSENIRVVIPNRPLVRTSDTITTVAYRTVIISDEEPAELEYVNRALWLHTATDTLYSRHVETHSWEVVSGLVVQTADPTIRTIWRRGTNNEQFVPQYVDKDNKPVTIGSPNGDWAVVDQWKYNSEHKNYKEVTLAHVSTHFSSVLTSQSRLPGVAGSSRFAMMQSQYNYGLGGTIHDHNFSFDTLISAVNVTNTTPIGVMDFTSRENASASLRIRDDFNTIAPVLLADVSDQTFVNFMGTIADRMIDRYESNDYTLSLYGDTTAYNKTTRQGVRNWIATAPMVGLSPVYRPHMSVVGETVELFHHDGHRSTVRLNATEQDRIARKLIDMTDTRSLNAKMGKYARTAPPKTVSEFQSSLGVLRNGVYWYSMVAGKRGLHRMSAIAVINTDPGVYDAGGNAILNGSMYYNTTVKAVFRMEDNMWVQITDTGAEDISPLWTDANPSLLLGSVYFEIEKRLYDVAQNTEVAFDYSSLIKNEDDAKVHTALLRSRFMTYVNAENIRTPFVNSTYTPSNALTWNYTQSAMALTPIANASPLTRASWQSLYEVWFNTPYPHLEPWAIQGYTEKPTWWDAEYASTTSSRRWTDWMWLCIEHRIVPAGRILPNGNISTGRESPSIVKYNYVCVNTSTDAMLPPYSTFEEGFGRSIFNKYEMIVAPDADYVFGDGSPVEWEWSVSSQQPFDNGVIAFQMQPARFLHSAFGPKFVSVDGLQVETEFKQVYSHEDAMFHGDLYDGNRVYSVGGLNQLYVNFNRFTGYDTNGEFRQLWAGWNPKQTYQFGSIVDTGTFDLSNRNFEVLDKDYNIILANSGVIQDHWVDSFAVSLVSVPPAVVQYNNQAAWRIELDVTAEVPRTISYYGVRSYPFSYDSTAKQFTIYSYDIVDFNVDTRRLYVSGDQTQVFTENRSVSVTNEHGETKLTVASSVYEVVGDVTRVNVLESLPQVASTGKLNVLDVKLPWELGAQVVVGSSKFVPAPLYPDTPYFVIPTGERTFMLADVFQDALANLPIDITTPGDGEMTVSELDSSFFVFGGSGNSGERWYHYVLDKDVINTFIPPMNVSGMQNFINIIDGYAALQRDIGIVTPNSSDTQEFDPLTGRQIDWMVETERFIDWAYGIRQAQLFVSDSYRVAPSVDTNTLTYVDAVPFWRSGTSVSVSSTGTLPTPLFPQTQYFLVTTGNTNTVRLSLSSNAADVDSWVVLEDTGSGLMSIGSYERRRSYPQFEMNVTRNVMCVNTPYGVLSDVVEGPYSDIRVQQTIFDQYNRPLNKDQLMVLRQDKQTRINITTNLPNDIDPMLDGDPYNAIHIGGAHLFVEGFEHYLMFNDYAVSGALIYDQFYGLAASRFEVDFFEQRVTTMRPTLGGFFLSNGQFKRNLEGSVSDIARYYDTSTLSESSQEAAYARKLLGYNGRKDYLDLIGINGKSQFLFYKGMIQSKGSVNSVNAYTNSRHFIDAAVDEYWAYKVAEFGDKRMRVYPEIKLFPSDSLLDDVRLEFMTAKEEPTDPMFVRAKENGFKLISFVDDTRWNNFPQQRAEIISPLFLDATLDELTVLYTGIAPPPPGAESTVQYWIDTLNIEQTGPIVHKYDKETSKWIVTTDLPLSYTNVVLEGDRVATPVSYIGHKASDGVRALRRTVEEREYTVTSATGRSFKVAGDISNDIQSGVAFVVRPLTGNIEVLTAVKSVFDGSDTTVTVTALPKSDINGGTIIVRDFNSYTTEIITAGTGDNEFTRVNSENVRFSMQSLDGLVVLFTINPATNKINPAKLIDTSSQTVVQQMPLWHPAVGIHSPTAMHNIKLQHAGDPAFYEFTLNPLSASASGNFWNNVEVNNTWLDTAHLGYVPYYDDAVFPDVNDRLFSWGKLAPWGSVKTYMWTASPVHPSAWDDLVRRQANDLSIPQNDKATGTPKTTVNRRTRQQYTATVISDTQMSVPRGAFTYEQNVTFAAEESLPTALVSGRKYVIATIAADQTNVDLDLITLRDILTEEDIVLTNDGKGTLKITPSFTADMWTESVIETDRVTAAFAVVDSKRVNNDTTNVQWPNRLQGKFVWKPKAMTAWSAMVGDQGDLTSDVVDLYVNAVLVQRGLTVHKLAADATSLYVNLVDDLVLAEYDIIDIVRPVHLITTDEEAFDPDGEDDGTVMVQWKQDYSYSTRTITTGSEAAGYVSTTMYYFWVENATVRTSVEKTALSVLEAARQLEAIPTAYTVVQRPEDDPYLTERYGYGIMEYGSIWSLGALSEAMYKIPVQYRECVLRKISTYLTDSERFIVRFTRDWTLRDDLTANGLNFNLKDKHEEWQLFRRRQPGRVPSKLWEALTNSVVGYKFSDTAVYDATTSEYVRSTEKVRVPSLEREMYDDRYGTDSQYGLGPDQTFVKREYALATILAYLTNENHNFWPLNVDAFFDAHNFNTPEAIQSAMAEIYQTFPVEHINGIWFETLSDALATKSKYRELMKTSWLALHGVRLMDVAGTFDE